MAEKATQASGIYERAIDPHARHVYLLEWRESREIGGFTRFTVLK